jgi:hypothetical protein
MCAYFCKNLEAVRDSAASIKPNDSQAILNYQNNLSRQIEFCYRHLEQLYKECRQSDVDATGCKEWACRILFRLNWPPHYLEMAKMYPFDTLIDLIRTEIRWNMWPKPVASIIKVSVMFVVAWHLWRTGTDCSTKDHVQLRVLREAMNKVLDPLRDTPLTTPLSKEPPEIISGEPITAIDLTLDDDDDDEVAAGRQVPNPETAAAAASASDQYSAAVEAAFELEYGRRISERRDNRSPQRQRSLPPVQPPFVKVVPPSRLHCGNPRKRFSPPSLLDFEDLLADQAPGDGDNRLLFSPARQVAFENSRLVQPALYPPTPANTPVATAAAAVPSSSPQQQPLFSPARQIAFENSRLLALYPPTPANTPVAAASVPSSSQQQQQSSFRERMRRAERNTARRVERNNTPRNGGVRTEQRRSPITLSLSVCGEGVETQKIEFTFANGKKPRVRHIR